MSKIFSYIPSAYKVRKTYTAIPNLASADFDFSRAGTADRIDPNGNVETMTGNVPRIDYANGGCPELLLDTGELCNGSQATFNDSEGVFQTKIRALSDDLTVRAISINNGASNSYRIRYNEESNTVQALVVVSGTPVQDIEYEVSDITEQSYIELVWNNGTVSFRVDGVKVGEEFSVSSPIGISEVNFDEGGGVTPFYGRTNEINVYDSSTDIKTFASPTELMQFANYEIIE